MCTIITHSCRPFQNRVLLGLTNKKAVKTFSTSFQSDILHIQHVNAEQEQWRSQPHNLVMLCKFKSLSFISLEIDSLYGL